MINHKEPDVIKALGLNEEEFKKVSSILQDLRGTKVEKVVTAIKETDIAQSDIYVSIFAILLLNDSMNNSVKNYIIENPSIDEAINKDTIRNSINTLVTFTREMEQDDNTTRIVFAMIPLLIMASNEEIPVSFIIETMTNLLKIMDISIEDILLGASTLGVMLDPTPTNDDTGVSNLQ